MTDTPYGERRNASTRFLPPDPSVEAPYRLTPGLALRVGVLGVVALAIFAVLFFRLWSLQVLSGDTYLAAAPGQPAPHDPDRGAARDDPRPQREADRRQRRGHRGEALGRRPAEAGALRRHQAPRLACSRSRRRGSPRRWTSGSRDPLNPITVKTAVGEDQVAYLYEHQAEFPGVQIQQTYLRHYPHQSLGGAGARLRRRGLADGARQPSEALPLRRQGRQGRRRGEVRRVPPRRGRARRRSASTRSAGRRARSSRSARRAPGTPCGSRIDIGLQRAAERALRYGIATARAERVVARERRRDRRARPARRRRARDGLDPDVQAVGLRRARRPEEDPAARQRQRRAEGELPGHQPRHDRRLPAGLDLEARRRARGDAGAPARAVPVDLVHPDRDLRPRQAGVQELGPVRQPRR